MLGHTAATLLAAANTGPNTQGLADWLQKIFGPLFLAIVGIVALFFLFTREITRFVQFLVLAVAIAVIFYYPGLIQSVAKGIASALGVSGT
jgi:cation transport ATPase